MHCIALVYVCMSCVFLYLVSRVVLWFYLQHICDCAVYYVGKVYTRVTDEDIYREGQFHASEKVSVLLCIHNNVCECVDV